MDVDRDGTDEIVERDALSPMAARHVLLGIHAGTLVELGTIAADKDPVGEDPDPVRVELARRPRQARARHLAVRTASDVAHLAVRGGKLVRLDPPAAADE